MPPRVSSSFLPSRPRCTRKSPSPRRGTSTRRRSTDEALKLLEHLTAVNLTREERQNVDLYRALCLLALSRKEDADRVVESMVALNPLYRPQEDLSPRMMTAFSDAKKRVLPTLVQAQYREAKSAFDRKAFADAATGFRRVMDALEDPDMVLAAKQPPLSDLGTLASGFHDLSVKAIPPPPAAPEPPKAVPAPVILPPKIFVSEDRGVVPPVVLSQVLPKYPGRVRPGGMTGAVEIIINETGGVESTTTLVSLGQAYDEMVRNAAAKWMYEPAKVNGMPVKFRRRIQISVSGQP